MTGGDRPGGLPLVSVVMPCHDAAAFVAQAIGSVLGDGYPAVEVVVVDDASTDGSREVVASFVERDPGRVRLVPLAENRGGGHARNRGVEAARGDLLFFLDADDAVAPGTLSALVVAATGDGAGTMALCPSADLVEEGGAWVQRNLRFPRPPGDDHLRAWLEGSSAPTCSLLWRRDAYLLAEGGWDETLTRDQDWDVALRALAAGARVVAAGGGLGLYRRHGESRVSVSSSVTADRIRSRMRVREKLAATLEAQGRLGAYAALIGRDYHHLAVYAYQQGFRELGRECLARGRRLAGRRLVSPTPVGRALEGVFGLEGKERWVRGLARLGIMTRRRRALEQATEALRSAEAAPGGREIARDHRHPSNHRA